MSTSQHGYTHLASPGRAVRHHALVLEPFLQFNGHDVYNPLTGWRIDVDSDDGGAISACALDSGRISGLPESLLADLLKGGWIVEDDGALERRFVLRYVSLETHTVCNQACYFCPVSTDPRAQEFMPDDLHRSIVDQLSAYAGTIVGVFMMSYNEPTLDPRFVDHVRLLRASGLPPAVNSNGTGLTPDRIEDINAAGGLVYLEVNLSTLDRQKYANDRAGDHLGVVLRNLDYLSTHPVSDRMEISVLGHADEAHHATFRDIQERFAGSPFRVRFGEIMDRAGHVNTGRRPPASVRNLGGCDNTGSRTVEHLHITPQGRCVICCQDYFGKYVVGDLRAQTIDNVLKGDEFARIRRWTYGMEQAPENFLCRKCVFAVPAPTSKTPEAS
jgi:hypothetical protein